MNLINFVLFQLGWFACVLSAANGRPWLGLLVVLLIVAGHIRMSSRPAVETKLVMLAVASGLVFDSFLSQSGWLQYAGGMYTGIAPYWILAMWALFATTLNASMGWLKDKLLLAAILGAIFGPLSYLAGQRLGALQIVDPQASLASLALIWAFAMPLLMFAANRLNASHGPAPIRPTPEFTGEQ